MNRFFLILLVSLFLSACSSKTNSNQEEDATATESMLEFDLSAFGTQAIILLPDTTLSPLETTILPSGELEIRVGKGFQVMIAEGGDIELKKSDIETDLLYKGTVLKQTDNSLLYKSELPDGSLSFHHFYVIKEINGNMYELSDIDNGEPFSENEAEIMLKSALALKSKVAS